MTKAIDSLGRPKRYQVYQLRASDESLEFYIGKTYYGSGREWGHTNSAIKNPRSFKDRKIQSILTRGATVLFEVLHEFDNERDQLAKERELIATAGKRCDNSGYLTNLKDGGEGKCGWKHTLERNKIISDKLRARYAVEKRVGHKVCPISVFTTDGVFVGYFKRIMDAADSLGINVSSLSTAVYQPEKCAHAKSIYGPRYQAIRGLWIDNIPPVKTHRTGRIERPVLQFSLSGELVGRYVNAMTAARETGSCRRTIEKSIKCRLKTNRHIYVWRHEKFKSD